MFHSYYYFFPEEQYMDDLCLYESQAGKHRIFPYFPSS